ncbi:SDR family oxidoreductase [bacterium]|nr:MAG: SDR family oxidoreductase [bacterium]MCL4232549.1 SDR family oxidoreductase [Dehalococcoidia bacterium]
MRLKGKVAAVTGGASGIGKGIAYAFAREGAAVAIGDIDEEGASAAATEIAEETGARTLGMRCDVVSRADLDGLVAAAADKFGRFDIMVANAGIAIFRPPLETTEEDWDSIMDVNAKGVLLSDQAAARQMIAEGHGGAIVNIASVAALMPSVGLTAYCASKAAVMHMTKCFALDLAQYGIRVTSIAPGLVDTPLWGKGMGDPGILDHGLRDQFATRVPLGRMATADDIAKMVAFLVSDEGEYLTGHIFVVDGGQSLAPAAR